MDFNWILIFQIIETAALIAAVFVAIFAIKHQRATTKKDKTIALLMKDLEDDFLKAGLETLRKIHNSQDDDVTIYANLEHSKSEQVIDICNVLNYYENIAVGVKADIYDIEMIKKSQKSMIIGIYEQSKPIINKLRETENNPNLYIEFKDFIKILKS